MNYLPQMTRISQLHRDRALAVTTALAAAWIFWVIADLAGSMSWIGLAAMVAATLVLLGNSDSYTGLILLCAMILEWWLAGPGADSWWVLPAALLVLVAHVAVALAASGPDQAPIPGAVLASWVRRTVLVGVATTLVAVLGLLIAPTNSSVVPYAVALALIALAAGALLLMWLTADSKAELGSRGRSTYSSMYERTRR